MASLYQKKIIQQFERDGYGVIKMSKTNRNGIADLLVSKKGAKPKLVETKEKNDTIKPLQVAQNKRLAELMDFDFIVMQSGKGQIDVSHIDYSTDLF
jgi:hypothetical protein